MGLIEHIHQNSGVKLINSALVRLMDTGHPWHCRTSDISLCLDFIICPLHWSKNTGELYKWPTKPPDSLLTIRLINSPLISNIFFASKKIQKIYVGHVAIISRGYGNWCETSVASHTDKAVWSLSVTLIAFLSSTVQSSKTRYIQQDFELGVFK